MHFTKPTSAYAENAHQNLTSCILVLLAFRTCIRLPWPSATTPKKLHRNRANPIAVAVCGQNEKGDTASKVSRRPPLDETQIIESMAALPPTHLPLSAILANFLLSMSCLSLAFINSRTVFFSGGATFPLRATRKFRGGRALPEGLRAL